MARRRRHPRPPVLLGETFIGPPTPGQQLRQPDIVGVGQTRIVIRTRGGLGELGSVRFVGAARPNRILFPSIYINEDPAVQRDRQSRRITTPFIIRNLIAESVHKVEVSGVRMVSSIGIPHGVFETLRRPEVISQNKLTFVFDDVRIEPLYHKHFAFFDTEGAHTP